MAIGSPQWMYKSGEAYTVDQGLKFEDGRTAYLSWTPESSGSATWTISMWVKRSRLSTGSDTGGAFISAKNSEFSIFFHSDDVLRIWDNGGNAQVYTSQVFRDISAWYHIVLKRTTSSPYLTLYVNGSEVTNYTTDQRSTYGGTTNFLTTQEHIIGGWNNGGYKTFDGYIAEVNVIDGQQLTPADFGETGTYGEWKPKEYSGTYGTNGFYLPFKNDYTVEGFSTVTYKGTGAGSYIGGVGFKSDLTWVKNRGSSGENHSLYDAVRGAGNPLYSNLTNAEVTSNHLTFKNDGFTLNTDNNIYSGNTYVAWNWDMGADTPTGFGAVAYKGSNTAAGRKVGNVGFSPDLVWIKRTNSADSHNIEDSVRGGGKEIRADSTNAEQDLSGQFGVHSFDSDGFTLIGEGGRTNNAYDYIAWCWDMGDTTVTNTSGSENSTVRANPTYGQSIVSYEGNEVAGTTYGHGLSSAPELMIVKNRSRTSDWKVYYGDNTKALTLNSNSPPDDQTYYWNDTSPTSSVFTTGGGTDTNGNNENLVAYCFHSVANYSKIGTYTGNGSTTGPSVNLGFRPAFVMIKVIDRTDGGNGAWWMYDSTRSFGTAIGNVSMANSTSADLVNNSNLAIDFLDNGFQLKASYDEVNVNGGTYVYMAFAGGVDSVSDFNTDGSLEARVKANPTYGQSIVSYTGSGSNATIGHGLSSAPEMVIIKKRNVDTAWMVYNHTVGNDRFLYLSGTNAQTGTDSSYWNNTTPSNSVVSLGTYHRNNTVNEPYIAYCWHSVTGYSKIGSYTGNGSSTGTSVTTGFAPAFVMLKRTDSTAGWHMYDNVRKAENPRDLRLLANTSDAEWDSNGGVDVDFNSTGFQLKTSDGAVNASGGTYIYMAFADKREYAYWLDQSGNNNDWTSNNLTESDISVDSPTNNFATWNPLDKDTDVTVSEGNLKTTSGTNANHSNVRSTFSMSTGKWYAELIYTHALGGSQATAIGIATPEFTIQNTHPVSSSSGFWGIYQSTGQEVVANGGNIFTPSAQTNLGDVIQIAFDADAQKFWLGVNNVWYNSSGGTTGNPATGANATASSVPSEMFLLADVVNNATQSVILNAGQDSSFAGNKTAQGNQDGNDIGDFYYTPPTGFLALCTSNLPDVAIKPQEHFEAILYTGTGSEHEISSLNFQPDLAWIRERPNVSNHYLYDSVRGATKVLYSDGNYAEQTDAQSLKSFDSDGYTLGTNTGVNQSSTAYVAWNWKANGSGSSNSNGSITSTVSANVDAGFSIINWTKSGSSGAKTVGHGLSKTPELIIFKEVDDPSDWSVWNGVTGYPTKSVLYLNYNVAEANSDANQWSNTAPTSTVFTYNQSYSFGGNNTAEMIGYAFHSVDGYSKVGTYIGNGSTDGTFVHTSFAPAFILWKNITDANTNWIIFDNKRDTFNPNDDALYPNATTAEEEDYDVDFLSNGFKFRNTSSWANSNGKTYIYLAFASVPFKFGNAK